MDNIYNTDNRESLILQLAEDLKDLTNWGKFDLPEEWERKIAAFDRIVRLIPTEHLERCVMYAAQNHKRNKEFAPAQVVESWSEIGEVISREAVGGHSNRQEQARCVYCSGTGFMYVKKIVDGKEVKAASKCKEKCKSTTNLSHEREPMPEELKSLLKHLGQKKSNRPDDMPINFRF